MRDKRPIDELSNEELERILAIRRREERMERFRRQQDNGRVVAVPLPEDSKALTTTDNSTAAAPMSPQQHEAALGVQSPDYPETYDITEDMPHFEDEDFEVVKFVQPIRKPIAVKRTRDENGDAPHPIVRRRINKLLLSVEVAAVIGLVVILFLAFSGLGAIQENTSETQRELEAIQALSRITPTPLPILTAGDLVLPGGHNPYNDSSDNFNDELEFAFDAREIPQNQRSALRRQIAAPARVSYEQQPSDPQLVDIPAIGKRNLSIVGGTDWETLKGGVGWFNNGARPGTDLNVVLSAHNDIYGAIFQDIHELQPGDEITLSAQDGRRYTYRVSNGQRVAPADTWVLDPNLGDGHGTLTLITCYPLGQNTHRWVVFAELVD
jgi:sortase A